MALSIAHESQPFQQFKDNKLNKESSGQKLQNIPVQSIWTNWQSPFLWTQIHAATVKVGYPYSQMAIVKEL